MSRRLTLRWALLGLGALVLAMVGLVVLVQPWQQTHINQQGIGAWNDSHSELQLVDTAESGVACWMQTGSSSHVVSDGTNSYLWSASLVKPLAEAQCQARTPLKLPSSVSVSDARLAGSTLALSTAHGVLRFSTASSSSTRLASKVSDPAVGVGSDGTVAIASAGAVQVASPSASTTVRSTLSVKHCHGGSSANCSVAVVAGHPVVLTRKGDLTFDNGTQHSLPGAVMATSGSPSDVPVATSGGLAAYDNSGGLVWNVAAQGTPLAAATDSTGCGYGAFDASGRVQLIRKCMGASAVVASAGATEGGCHPLGSVSSWTFQPSAQSAVLEASTGDAYLLTQDGRVVCIPWQSQNQNNNSQTAEKPRTASAQGSIHCSATSFYLVQPTPGTPSWPATAQCTDDAGLPLHVENVSPPSFVAGTDGASISPAGGTTPTQGQQISFNVSDGSNPPEATSATIVSCSSPSTCPPPVSKFKGTTPTIFLGQGASTTYAVLADFYSMTGEPLSAVAAVPSSSSASQIYLTASGDLVISNYSGAPTQITVMVEDVEGSQASEVVTVNPTGSSNSHPPVVHDLTVPVGATDQATTDQATTDLVNGDFDPAGGQLTVQGLKPLGTAPGGACPPPQGLVTQVTCTFSPVQVATSSVYAYQVQSSVSHLTTPAYVRFVRQPAVPSASSVSVSLPKVAGGQATADLLAPEIPVNPNVGVQSFDSSPTSPCGDGTLACQLIDDRYLRVAIVGQLSLLTKPRPISFVLQLGGSSQSAVLWVVPTDVPPSATPSLKAFPPQNAVTGVPLRVPVLVDSYSPTGSQLVVTSVSASKDCSSDVAVWTDGTSVFVEPSGSISGQCSITYVAEAPDTGAVAQQTFNTSVVPPDSPPSQAPPLTLRVYGGNGRVDLPTSATGQEGSATLPSTTAWLPVSLGGSPKCGVPQFTSDWTAIVYTMSARQQQDCGVGSTDSFTYSVRLVAGGPSVSGNVSVLIASSSSCPAPTALPVVRQVPLNVDAADFSVAPMVVDPCSRHIRVLSQLKGLPACLSSSRASGETISLVGLGGCPTNASISVDYVYLAGNSSPQVGQLEILRTSNPTSLLSVGSYLKPLDASAQLDLRPLVSGEVGSLTFARLVGPCKVSSDGLLQAPPSLPSTSASTCSFEVTDSATHGVAGGVVWLAGNSPTIEQIRTDQVIVPSRGHANLSLISGSDRYFTAVPSSYSSHLVPSNPIVTGATGCARFTPSLSGGVVSLTNSTQSASEQCELEVSLGITGSLAPERFQVPVLFEGTAQPSLSGCQLPPLYPQVGSQFDLSSCIDPGGFQLSELTVKLSSGDVQISAASVSASSPQVVLTPGANTRGAKVVVTAVVCQLSGTCSDPHQFSGQVLKSQCRIVPSSPSEDVPPGSGSFTVPSAGALAVASGGPQCDWEIVSAEVASGPSPQPTVRVDGKNLTVAGIKPPTGTSVQYVISFFVHTTDEATNRAVGTATITVLGKPAAPSISPNPAVGNGYATVSWVPPASDGGSPISGYVLQYKIDGATSWTTDNTDCSVTATSCTVTGLANGKGYVFQVAAKNAVDTGDWSPVIGPVVPITSPDAPRGLKAFVSGNSPGNAQVQVSWLAPASDGGSPIGGYVLQYKIDGATSWTTDSADCSVTATSCTVTGLANGTGYVFQVAATNSSTDNLNFVQSSRVPIPATKPTQPTWPTSNYLTLGDGRVQVSWLAPASDGGSQISGYVLQYRIHGATSWTTDNTDCSVTATSCTVTGLANGTIYEFQVAATNAVDTGDWSATSDTAIPAKPVQLGVRERNVMLLTTPNWEVLRRA